MPDLSGYLKAWPGPTDLAVVIFGIDAQISDKIMDDWEARLREVGFKRVILQRHRGKVIIGDKDGRPILRDRRFE